MPSPSESKPGRYLLFAAGTSHYVCQPELELSTVPGELTTIEEVFAALGYERLLRDVSLNPERDNLLRLIGSVADACAEGDFLVIYYTGHGVKDTYTARYYLLTSDSDKSKLSRTAMAADQLAQTLFEDPKAAQILVILDACWSAAGAGEIACVTSEIARGRGNGPGTYIIAAARSKEEADPGLLVEALKEVLTSEMRKVGLKQPYVFPSMEAIVQAIKDYFAAKQPAQVATGSIPIVEGICRLFPNPKYRRDIPPGVDLETQRAFIEHWVPKARGAEVAAGGWYFTGREQALRELVAWLCLPTSGNRARVVTGGPGCGKSAVLARIVTLSNPTYRKDVLGTPEGGPAESDLLPPEGLVNVAIHARHLLLDNVVLQIAEALDLPASNAGELVDALRQRVDKTVIVVDALDEANDQAAIVSKLLCPLAELPQIFLLIGTRPDTAEHGPRFRALGDFALEIDLDDARYIGANDVARYVERRLLASEEPGRTTPYRAAPAIARTVAQAIAERAKNVFLVAHTTAIALLSQSTRVDISKPGWVNDLPTGLDEAFDKFIGELDRRRPSGLSSSVAKAVLMPLVFSEGQGLPWSNLWSAIATEISDRPVSDEDISLVCQHAAPFIVEALESDRSVYRLYHEAVAERMRSSNNESETQRRIVSALRTRVPLQAADQQPDWARAHPYIRTHLASHALKAQEIGNLVSDGLYVAAADPQHLLQALAHSTDAFARRAYAGYEMAFGDLLAASSENRLSYLEFAALQIGDDALAHLWTARPSFRKWKMLWVRAPLMSPHRVIPASRSNCIALGKLGNRPVIVSGELDGTVRRWDLASGGAVGEPLRGHQGWVMSVTLGNLGDRPVIVSGGTDGFVRVWDLASGMPVGDPLRGQQVGGHQDWVTAVALGNLGDRPVIVSGGGDGTVRAWDVFAGAQMAEPSHAHQLGVNSVALGNANGIPLIISAGEDDSIVYWAFASGLPADKAVLILGGCGHVVALSNVGDRPVFVSDGMCGTMRVWDLAKGEPIGEPLKTHHERVYSIALGNLRDRPVIVSGAAGTVDVWDLESRTQINEQISGQGCDITSVALGKLGGEPVIVAVGTDHTVRIWDSFTGALVGEPLRGQLFPTTTVALGTLCDRPVIVSGGYERIQVRDLASGALIGEPLCVHQDVVISVALVDLGDLPVIVSGGSDCSLRVWNLATGAPIGEPLRGNPGAQLTSVALGELGGMRVIVAGVTDGTVLVWSLSSRAPVGAPLHGHQGKVTSVAIGYLGKQSVIVSGGEDDTVCVWDMASMTRVGEPLRADQRGVHSVVVSNLGERPVIASCGENGTVRVWNFASGGPIHSALHAYLGATSIALGKVGEQPVIVAGGAECIALLSCTEDQTYVAVHISRKVTSVACADDGTVIAGIPTGLLALQFNGL